MRTCLADIAAPSIIDATRRVLERCGVEVAVPRAQTCCGQPGWSAGHPDEARRVARRALRAFRGDDPVVVPSGSCAAMVTHGYLDLFTGRPEEAEARQMAERTVELSQFLHRNGLRPESPAAGSVTLHDSCHMLRLLGERESARAILADAAPGVELREMAQTDVCCGFGGTFALKNADTSTAMLADKMANVLTTRAEVVTAGDSSCLMHIGGGLSRMRTGVRTMHLAEILASTEADVQEDKP